MRGSTWPQFANHTGSIAGSCPQDNVGAAIARSCNDYRVTEATLHPAHFFSLLTPTGALCRGFVRDQDTPAPGSCRVALR